MANELDNPKYTAMIQAPEQPSYDSPQQVTPQYEMVQVPKLVPAESKEASSNVQHHSNCVGNYSNQKERMIVIILLIISTLLNVTMLITFFTKETSCPQVINTTQMAAQAGCGNTTDGMILQQINNSMTTLLEMVGNNTQLLDGHIVSSKQSQQLVNHNITTLIDMVGDNTLLHISSCQDVKNLLYPSGYYHINNESVYCETGELCNSEGVWTRLAYLDMNDSTVDCPPGFKLYEVNGVRACGRPDSQGGSCVSIKFPSNGISYSEVCGRVVGYQYGTPEALQNSFNNIDSYYVDGVSITQGYPREHVWTLITGLWSNQSFTADNCPCNTPPGPSTDVTSFIGNDYFCESGNPNSGWSLILYSNDPLWDGKQCGSNEQDCCTANGLPWFHKTLNSTTDYLELRVCGDDLATNEDVPISLYELYVK